MVGTIQAGGIDGCKLYYPVALIYKSKHYPRWKAADQEYCIQFVGTSPFSEDPIDVPDKGKSKRLDITGNASSTCTYYKYDVWDQCDSGTNTHGVCEFADDDRDAGLNMKP